MQHVYIDVWKRKGSRMKGRILYDDDHEDVRMKKMGKGKRKRKEEKKDDENSKRKKEKKRRKKKKRDREKKKE